MTTTNDQSIATTPPANQSLATQPKPPKPAEILRAQLQARQDAFALPKHISPEKFISVATTAVVMDPALLGADRASLLQACLLAAQDGLLLDKRQAALVVFNQKAKDENGKDVKDAKGKDVWVKKVQYMPMVAGILKKLRNSGELSTIIAECVYENDKFTYRLGLNQCLDHEPNIHGDRGKLLCVYAVAKLKDGSQVFRVMTLDQVVRRMEVSKSKTGPWVDWYDEMACKTVLRALCKVLPSSTDIDRLIENMDRDTDFTKPARRDLPSLTEPDDAVDGDDGGTISVDGEVVE
jgi:recombination protein RecT